MSLVFAWTLYTHYKQKPKADYLFWWMLGVITFAISTTSESVNTLFGWSEFNFKCWYIMGAIIGGAPLAQGTAYLLLPKKLVHRLTLFLVTTISIASVFVIASPINSDLIIQHRMSGNVFAWSWVRLFSPFLNLYALLFLAGGAIYSAFGYFKKTGSSVRFWGNILIAIGAILPGIGGSFTRYGFVEVLYVTEFIGLLCIIIGYKIMRNDQTISIHRAQRKMRLSNNEINVL